MNDGARKANEDAWRQGVNARLDEIVRLLTALVAASPKPDQFANAVRDALTRLDMK